MDWLEPPFHFFHPQPELPFELPVVRYEVGLAQRPIVDPPGFVNKPTIRFHLAKPIPPGLWLAIKGGGSLETDRVSPEELEQRPYLDFTNKILIQRVLAIYDELLEETKRTLALESIPVLEALSGQRPRPLRLRLIRHGLRIDTIYDVELLGAG